MPDADAPLDPVEVAKRLAASLDQRAQDYALGGAIALGYWAEPRGTIDVDLTVYLPPEKPSQCVWLLGEIGCEVNASDAIHSLQEHGFCRVSFEGVRVDVFLPTVPFYEAARARRRSVDLGGQTIQIWDAESLAVFKLMFFRRKDLADLEQILRVQGESLDRDWIHEQLEAMYGSRDPRVSQWKELADETA